MTYGLLTANYRLDREGLEVEWGLARERIPIDNIHAVTALEEQARSVRLPRTLPGYVRGRVAEDGTPREFFATDPGRLVRVVYGNQELMLSPPDPVAFQETFVAATRLGSLEDVQPVSQRPDLLPARLWSDGFARGLIGLGLLLPLSLLAFLALRAGALPETVPFGFLPGGQPGPPAPPGRLVLLPLINGLVWLVDLFLGAWMYRQPRQRPLAYLLWGAGVAVGALFWGALMNMVSAAA
jgi:hypothetical protein